MLTEGSYPNNDSSHYKKKLQEIKTKIKSPITKTREFKDDDAMIDVAINMYYEQLKRDKHLK